MTSGGKIALIIGGSVLLIGGGVGIYFLTKGEKVSGDSGSGDSGSTDTGVGSTSTTTDENRNEAIDKVTGYVNSSTSLFSSLKNFVSETGLFSKKDKTTLPDEVSKLADGKTLKASYKNKYDGSTRYVFTDGTLIDVLTNGKAEVTEDSNWEDDYEKLSANGSKCKNCADGSKKSLKKLVDVIDKY